MERSGLLQYANIGCHFCFAFINICDTESQLFAQICSCLHLKMLLFAQLFYIIRIFCSQLKTANFS